MAGHGPLIARTVSQLRAQVHDALAAHDFDTAFAAIHDTMLRAWSCAIDQDILSFGAAEVDDLCLLVGRRWLDLHTRERQDAVPTAQPLDLYIASQLYEAGGHTPLIGDFIRSTPARQAVLVVTNITNETGNVPETILRRVGLTASQVEVCFSAGHAQKFAWLIDAIDRNRPDRIFLFNHPQDGMAIAACQAENAREIVFVHHADRAPSVGACLASAVHVDVTPFCFHCCRYQGGISGNRFIPLIAADEGIRVRAARRPSFRDMWTAAGSFHQSLRAYARSSLDVIVPDLKPIERRGFIGLRTAAAGSPEKFRRDYVPNYFNVIAAVLKLTQGSHLHIGPLSDDDLMNFRHVLKRDDVDPERLVHVPHVSSVWQAMSDYGVHFYIGSFPIRGARTSIEVMGSGTPAAWHVTRPATRFHDTHMKYAGAETWQTLDELCDLIRRIDRPWMRRQSRLSRRHYDRNHHPRLMAACLRAKDISSHPVAVVAGGSSEPRLMSLDDLLSRA